MTDMGKKTAIIVLRLIDVKIMPIKIFWMTITASQQGSLKVVSQGSAVSKILVWPDIHTKS